MQSVCDRKRKRRVILGVIALFATLALLLAFIAGFTYSRYRQSMTGYVDYSISSFHTVLLGNMTEQEVRDSWIGSGAIRLFGEDVKMDVMQPGRANQVIPFSLANGTAEDNISSMDFDYMLRVRTTGNIPLKFVLKQEVTPAEVNEDGEEITPAVYRTFRSSTDYYVERDREMDAPRYIYPFYEELTDGDGNKSLASEETTFAMSGGVFQMQKFILEMEWPIVEGNEGESATNNQKYMKEVDVVDMIANVSTHNRSESYGENPQSSAHEYAGEGILAVYPNSEDGLVHQFEYRAFRLVDAAENEELAEVLQLDGSHSLYYYTISVNNGNNLYRDGQRIAENRKVSAFRVSIGIPQTKDTIYLSSSDETERQYYFCVKDKETGEMMPLSSLVSYRSYDLYTGTYSDITPEEAAAYLEEHPDYPEDSNRIYAVYTLTEEDTGKPDIGEPVTEPVTGEPGTEDPVSLEPKIFRMGNFTEDLVPDFQQIEFYIYIADSLPRLSDAETHQKALASCESRLFLEVSAVAFTDE